MAALGRRVPTDWKHVEKYPLRRLMRQPPIVAERTLPLPLYRIQYDQGQEGACVGFSCSWGMSILNRRLYDARRLYREAQQIDEWTDTPPEEGTSVRAGMDVLRQRGHWRNHFGRFADEPTLAEGIVENRWAVTVDEVRAAIQSGVPVVLGINWYSNFYTPQLLPPPSSSPGSVDRKEWWIGRSDLGVMRGGHAICAYRVSDRRQAVGLINTWGDDYPKVWMPYDVLQRMLNEQGEAAIPVDRVEASAGLINAP